MIDRRSFVQTVSLTTAGLLLGCSGETRAVAEARRRAVPKGLPRFRSAGGRLNAEVRASEETVMLGNRPARLFAFNTQVPGPLLEARAGDEVTLRFTNDLAEPTNLHFHGMHIPPTGSADNIFLHVPSGEAFTYEFTLPGNHEAGLFWFHPHLHGSVARQVSRGLAAPFVIRGDVDDVPEVTAADEHFLMLQDFELDASGRVIEPSLPQLMPGREGSLITAGGAINPVIPIRQDGLLRLRLVNASVARFYRLQLEQHPLHIIGVDGGPLREALTVDDIVFVPGQRLDLLIEGARPGGSFRLFNLPYDRGGMQMMGGGGMGGMMGGGSSGTNATPQTIATIEYRGRAEKRATVPRTLGVGPASLPASSLPERTFQLGQSMMGMGRDMSFTINGREFEARRIDTAPRLGTVEDWVYINATTMDHPMHLHTNSFRSIAGDGSLEPGWRDVILVKAGHRARFRVRFEDFAGKTVQHCHILDHEDNGMMATVEMQV